MAVAPLILDEDCRTCQLLLVWRVVEEPLLAAADQRLVFGHSRVIHIILAFPRSRPLSGVQRMSFLNEELI